MHQYLILAYDATDDQALERRMKVRPAHFEGVRLLKKHNNFIIGGAILDDNGKMTGSMMVVQFETKDELLKWMSHEPYITGNVWQNIEIKPYRMADV